MNQHTETRDLGEGAVLSLTLRPFPILVGTSSELYATLRDQRAAGTGCQVQYRQYLRDAGAGDTAFSEIPEQSRSGIYRTKSAIFGEEGVWRFEFKIECGEALVRRGVMFDYGVARQ